jgi:hypothetical protein
MVCRIAVDHNFSFEAADRSIDPAVVEMEPVSNINLARCSNFYRS